MICMKRWCEYSYKCLCINISSMFIPVRCSRLLVTLGTPPEKKDFDFIYWKKESQLKGQWGTSVRNVECCLTGKNQINHISSHAEPRPTHQNLKWYLSEAFMPCMCQREAFRDDLWWSIANIWTKYDQKTEFWHSVETLYNILDYIVSQRL